MSPLELGYQPIRNIFRTRFPISPIIFPYLTSHFTGKNAQLSSLLYSKVEAPSVMATENLTIVGPSFLAIQRIDAIFEGKFIGYT